MKLKVEVILSLNWQNNVENQFKYIEKELDELKDCIEILQNEKNPKKQKFEKVAIATYLGHIYNGIEIITGILLKNKSIKISKTDSWHKKLMDLAIKEGIIKQKHAKLLNEYRGFRHYWFHGYAHSLKDKDLERLFKEIISVYGNIKIDINKYIKQKNNKKL
jgi:uncharacterized protein YutE (UPF0331/DUF86 family)